MRKILLYIWQLPQNIIGFILSRFKQCKYTYPCGVVDKKEDVIVYFTHNVCGCGVSLGSYILLDTKNLLVNQDTLLTTIKHEYGHQKQSRILGWFYFFIIGIPSALGNLWDRVMHKNWSDKERIKWYYTKLPWERWAEKLGDTGRKY